MRRNLKITGAGLLGLAAAGCSAPEQPQKPNIIFYFADDMGVECFGAYGGVSYETPNIDRMAEEGIMYTNMHSMPLSTPSRVQVMTGRYNYKNYVNFGYINSDENTFAHLAQNAGYNTAIVGKWQLGRSRSMIGQLGFDEFCLTQLLMYKEFHPTTTGFHTDRYANSYADNNGKFELSLYGPEAYQDYAFDFIDRSVAEGKPFMLYYPTPLVHTPHLPTPDSECWDVDYPSRFVDHTRNFPDMVAYTDKQVGQIIDKLKRDGLWDNTIFIFGTDNGTAQRITSELKDGTLVQGGKSHTTDFGTHVPLIITWGDKIDPGQVSERLVDLVDLMPTFADAMGVTIPAEWDADGISLYPELIGEEPLERDYLICHFDPLWPSLPMAGSRHARTVRYKLYYDGRFYDTQEDKYEQSPISEGEGSAEAEQARTFLAGKLASLPAWQPGDPGAERRGDYGTFYDFSSPKNPF